MITNLTMIEHTSPLTPLIFTLIISLWVEDWSRFSTKDTPEFNLIQEYSAIQAVVGTMWSLQNL